MIDCGVASLWVHFSLRSKRYWKTEKSVQNFLNPRKRHERTASRGRGYSTTGATATDPSYRDDGAVQELWRVQGRRSPDASSTARGDFWFAGTQWIGQDHHDQYDQRVKYPHER